jgi:predicted aspartyl protease
VTHPFDPRSGLIIVHTELTGPSGSAILRLALDTGATSTLVNVGMLVAVGCDPATAPERVQVTTGSGVELVPVVFLDKVTALGQARSDFVVLGHSLPASAGIDGLLGLDFFREQALTIDFRQGEITLV